MGLFAFSTEIIPFGIRTPGVVAALKVERKGKKHHYTQVLIPDRPSFWGVIARFGTALPETLGRKK